MTSNKTITHIALLLMAFAVPQAKAQITIGGNVYGGGNEGKVEGSTTVTVRASEVKGSVFGGARLADVGGRAFVNIDGEHTDGEIAIKSVYGGNDIAGTVGTEVYLLSQRVDSIPQALTEVKSKGADTEHSKKNDINNSWSAFVRSTPTPTEDATHRIVIGSIFAGGNGDYTYTDGTTTGKYNVTIDGKTYTDIVKPNVTKAYLELLGGCLAYIYGGGNNATVTGNTTICINNPSKGLVDVVDQTNPQAELLKLADYMDFSTFQGNYSSLDYNAARVFGGNNKAAMAIRPIWNIQRGRIRDLYSGGNEGDMNSQEGLLVDIDPLTANANQLYIYNAYGGCRKADVRPKVNGTGADTEPSGLMGYDTRMAARLVVRGGKINNVYGGNDISGVVYGGNAVGIYSSILGSVYGGGNGSYAYTDNKDLANDPNYRDYYYDVNKILGKTEGSSFTGFESAQALNIFRPNAQAISIFIKGTDDLHRTVIGKSIFCGGNSASVSIDDTGTSTTERTVELKIGSYCTADSVYLGNNGANMITENLMKLYAGGFDDNGNIVTGSAVTKDYSQMDLTQANVFAEYMDGATMKVRPIVTPREDYVPLSTIFGSFYGGGNVGSVDIDGVVELNFLGKYLVYDKVVGGCNEAFVKPTEYNAAFDGGMLGEPESGTGNKVKINFSNLEIQPMRWKTQRDANYITQKDANGEPIYEFDSDGNYILEWNTVTVQDYTNIKEIAPDPSDDYLHTATEDRRLWGGNIYGGCYKSGHINGNVVIDLNKDITEIDKVFIEYDEDGTTPKTGNSYVDFDAQGEDVFATALSCFGAGYGKDTEVWGSTTVNLNNGYVFQVFGGGQEGVVGKSATYEAEQTETVNGTTVTHRVGEKKYEYSYDAKYSTCVNLKGADAGTANGTDLAETEYIYGGGMEGDVCGNTTVNLGNGRIYDAFGGACNADIYGYAETYIGRQVKDDGTISEAEGFPWIRDIVFGGNDLGGQIKSQGDFTDKIESSKRSSIYNHKADGSLKTGDQYYDVLKASTYVAYLKGRVDSIFGGNYGNYDYTEPLMPYSRPHITSSFVHFRPISNPNNYVGIVFGGSEGMPGLVEPNNTMQELSYVLMDDNTGAELYRSTDIYGGGAYSGLGSANDPGIGKSVVDLFAGDVHNVYGSCNREGMLGYARVNVPAISTIHTNAIFGGGKGYSDDDILDTCYVEATPDAPCDTYVACVDYRSSNATVEEAIYGGNHNSRIACDTYVNICSDVKNKAGQWRRAFGAGYGAETVSGRTTVFMNDGAVMYEVYGGGRNGNVFNYNTLRYWLYGQYYKAKNPSFEWWKSESWDNPAIWTDNVLWNDSVHNYGLKLVAFSDYIASHPITLPDEISTTGYDDIIRTSTDYHNTNVHIHEGGAIRANATGDETGNKGGYAYGGGYGADATVAGTTFFRLEGGSVEKDIYGGGWGGPVLDEYKLALDTDDTNDFTAGTYVSIEGGTVRNVYGGGYNGAVGYAHYYDKEYNTQGRLVGEKQDPSKDISANTHVTIGKLDGTSFIDGIPAVKRNVYAGGEGGNVFGTANLTINNGYIGYRYKNTGTTDAPVYKYVEELDDWEENDNRLYDNGNAFGGGYVASSYVDHSHIKMYGGTIRGSMYGGGEIGPIGMGTMLKSGFLVKNPIFKNDDNGAWIFRPGSTLVEMYGGQVNRNVFGGGRGKDSWGGSGWRSEEEADLTSKGYVFGTTEVRIRGGNIGTEAGLIDGYGNVFGGGDIGYVYSYQGLKNSSDGYYYKSGSLTEDCKVVIEPYCKVTTAYGSHEVGDYVPTEELDTYPYTSGNWNYLDQEGITIYNAVFAGGNVSSGSDQIYANTSTVYGNATASVIDLYEKDLISIGDDGVGGLYGDGNLTFVDGYRELNITNYGTDYNHLSRDLPFEDYQNLNKRQRAYYELKYKAKTQHTYTYYMCTEAYNSGTATYKKGQKITQETYDALDATQKEKWVGPRSTTYDAGDQISENEYDLLSGNDATDTTPATGEKSYWDLHGYCTLFEGRMINTLQRADFCGVFGSRIVLRGARDRVPSFVDYTDYTINRVKELSLNQVSKNSTTNGNYFGIYNVVNYLGALTSDVKFNDVRTYDNSDAKYAPDFTGQTYYEWKKKHNKERLRNNGTSQNEVALASGVWLEILDESTETAGEKVYGPITGIVQLDLLNVATGEGGGYVYAKNIHGTRSETGNQQVTLAASNQGARSYKMYDYANATASDTLESSGNFIHPTKRIIDDCYPESNSWVHGSAAAGHYWFIRGEFYVYDQYISAYTGSGQAYADSVSIPLTITAEAQGKLQLISVQPNLYAFWDDNTLLPKYRSSTDENAIVINNVSYHKNDPISYWEWSHLTEAEQDLFTEVETWVCSYDATYGGTEYKAGDAFLSKPVANDIYVCTYGFTVNETTSYQQGDVITATTFNSLSTTAQSNFALVFNRSNVVDKSHGFVLTFDWSNPDIWNDYYHQDVGTGKVRSSAYSTVPSGYIVSPSFLCTTPGVYGQKDYTVGDIIGQAVHDEQTALGSNTPTSDQATFAAAYVAKEDCQFTNNGTTYEYVKGACITAEAYDALSAINKGYFDEGMICTETYSRTETEHYLYGQVIPKALYTQLNTENSEVATHFSSAYLCTTAGLWGGEYFVSGRNYSAIKYSNLSTAERANFTYNYDALNLLVDEQYQDIMPLYDSDNVNNGNILYAKEQSIDYTATYNGTGITLKENVDLTRNGNPVTGTNTLQNGDVLDNTNFETLVNEQLKYSPIVVMGNDVKDNYYVVDTLFTIGDKTYTAGTVISEDLYDELGTDQNKVTIVSKTYLNSVDPLPTGNDNKRYYFCTETYTPSTTGTGVPTGVQGTVISSSAYGNLTNEQKNFTIEGSVPTQTSTLYVAREPSIDELSKDRIITVVYNYDYVESDETNTSYETIREKHIVNVHIHFESGVPNIGQLLPPKTILPGNYLSLNQPTVSKGAYEVIGGGWEIYSNETEALRHQNGADYVNNGAPLYWYQDGYWVAYYAKTYLGKTYSNPVEISVANYHDLDKVMQDKENHMYLDHRDAHRQRNPKIYIDNRECTSDPTKNELDLLKDFFDLTLQPRQYDATTEKSVPIATSGALSGHHGVDTDKIGATQNLDFFLRSDIAPKKYTDWTPIGSDTKNGNTYTQCFEGTLHGDGHTISGLNNSLFKSLCGQVYNLGVTGTFSGAGIVDTGTGYVENCWVMTDAATVDDVKAVFGNPDDTENPTSKQVVNCYYPEANAYSETDNAHGNARKMPARAFYNGEVTYDLNGFYLQKRYFDHTLTSAGTSNKAYYSWRANADGTLPTTPEQNFYSGDYALYPLDEAKPKLYGYVEDRYADGDYVYAGGYVPEDADQRYYESTATGKGYYPIWPDDYLFFGQMLSYGWDDLRPHQDLPTTIAKGTTGRLPGTAERTNNNVWRAPAYYGNATMSMAHFNPQVNLAAKSKDGTKQAYPGMTAIDFAGHNDVYTVANGASKAYEQGLQANDRFFPPLLDDHGLASIVNRDETQNLLAYAPSAATNATTKGVLETYFADPSYSTYYQNDATYRNVLSAQSAAIQIKGHIVNSDLTSTRDHLLVDKQSFNAPVSYTFGSDYRMWYQRVPDVYVDTIKGWEGVSLPFQAELVSTNDKGEITHFYGGSNDSYNGTGTKYGHEYWLREYAGNVQQKKDENNQDITGVYVADFNYPAAITGGATKDYTNTFLWDYYYSKNSGWDANRDTYQQQYYGTAREYAQYAYTAAAKPYIIGFPGTTYYEFDLSGGFTAAHTYQGITRLGRQTVTFASRTGITVDVSDDECRTGAVTADSYTFHPNYLGKTLPYSDTAGDNVYYVLKADGTSYQKQTADAQSVPFRPYFTTTVAAPSRRAQPASEIAFGGTTGIDDQDDADMRFSDSDDGLVIYARRGKIVVESHRKSDAVVRILNTSGITVDTYSIQPGETVETPIHSTGVYIANRKKLRVEGR